MQNAYYYDDYAQPQSCCEYKKYIDELSNLTQDQPLT